ncbi:PREDICTED: apolipoprotein D-like isoform X2 [Rhagoletis zephyria]|uniref:apolipoprotein D-like isoform X1 n=1 Tax=Rhagoletis zephyria TaxID=28612 RepID=UPI0008113107|nr:PREDICTED: apolipoprotein D-like isoform X1 [Rhagoletis zephyria]XP_017478860.1 PREDICTED: apolipoprotein D-like isoform X2 [Rhagoletis zephyria]
MQFQLRVSFYAACLLLIAQLTVAQVPFPRSCPEVKVPTDFNADAYMGTWYEYAKYPHIFEIAKRCMSARYSSKGNNTIGVLNTSINTITGHITNTTGVARLLAPSQINVLFSKFPNSVDIPNYIVLGTDYKSYSVVYSCTNITAFAHTKLLWIMTRERKPSPEAVSTAKKIMEDNNLPQSFLLIADQENCPEVYPSYGVNIHFGGDNSNTNNNANQINKTTNNQAEAADDVISVLKPIVATATSTQSPTPADIDELDNTAETAANVIEMA